MARTRTPAPAPGTNGHAPQGLRSLQGAAHPLIPDADRSLSAQDVQTILRGPGQQADELCWYFYDRIPELRYLARFVANSVSLARLYIARKTADPENPEQVGPRHAANELLDGFAGGFTGQAELLDRLALHLTITGDSVVMGPTPTAPPLRHPFNEWRTYSTSELYSGGAGGGGAGGYYLRSPAGRQDPVPEGALPVRIWRPHPHNYWAADSPTRACLGVLREIDLLDSHIRASAISRLAGAGLLFVPDEMSFPSDEVETEGEEVDAFVRRLTDIFSIAIKNRESAAALVPVILQAPADLIQAIKLVTFSTPFDQEAPNLRVQAVKRLAIGSDLPAEMLTGLSDSTHWAAWQIDESVLRLHTKPLLQLICNSLTTGWLRPVLNTIPLPQAVKDDIQNLLIWFDVSQIKIRPDTTAEAEAMYDRLELSGNALRLNTGYGPDSAPTDKERAEQILFMLLKDPSMSGYAVNALRDNYGLKRFLPEAPGVRTTETIRESVNPTGAPLDPQAPAQDGGQLPGRRSQDKQTAPPPPPPPGGDGSRNTPAGPVPLPAKGNK